MKLKSLLFSGLMLATFTSSATIISPIYKYILNSGKVVELQGENVAQDSAYYFDYEAGKRVYVKLSEASVQTKQRINGVRAGEFVAARTNTGDQVCLTYNVFENGMAYIGCRTGAYQENIGPTRYSVGGYTAHTSKILAEAKEVDGFSKGEVALLNGKKVKILAIFENGLVLTHPASLISKLDTSSDLLKLNVKIVKTLDLEKR